MKTSIIKDLINLIQSSDFYNKIQVITETNGEQTETFYFYDGGIGHAILLTKLDNNVETIQETKEISIESIIENLKDINPDSKMIIAGNSGDNILTIKNLNN
jgi:hypothetical protein